MHNIAIHFKNLILKIQLFFHLPLILICGLWFLMKCAAKIEKCFRPWQAHGWPQAQTFSRSNVLLLFWNLMNGHFWYTLKKHRHLLCFPWGRISKRKGFTWGDRKKGCGTLWLTFYILRDSTKKLSEERKINLFVFWTVHPVIKYMPKDNNKNTRK